IRTPYAVFPEMMLRAAAVVPPTVLPEVPLSKRTPERELGRAAVPAALVPMLFPLTTVAVVPGSWISMPDPLLPEITLRAPGAVPPIPLLALEVANTPIPGVD